MEKTAIKDFTRGNVTKQLIVFSLPLFLSNLLQIVYNMVDMIVVGKVLGKVGISSVSVGGDVSMLMTFIAMGFSSAGQVIIAKYVGAGERRKIGRFVGTMTGFLLCISLIVTAIGLIFREPILKIMNTPSEAYAGALSYSVICISGLFFIYGYNIVSAILRGMGDSKTPFVFISIAAILNVVLDIMLVMRLGMGAGGAALATVISQATSFVLCAAYLVLRRGYFGLDTKVRDFIFWNREMLLSLSKLGVPMAIKFAAVQVSKLFVNSFINSYGVAVSAFSGIANKIAGISNLISNAMVSAGSTMVGQNIAAKRYTRVKSIMLNLVTITLTVSAIMTTIIGIFPKQVFALFMDEPDPEVLAIAPLYVPIAALMFFGSSARAFMNSLMNGSGNTKVNFATAILDGIVLRIGLALLFGLGLGMRHFGFWIGDALAGYTPFFIGIVFYFSGRWKAGRSVKNK